jgi:hypothetical protein
MIWNDTFPVGGGKSLNASKAFVMNMYMRASKDETMET